MIKLRNRKNLITVLVTIVCISACFLGYPLKTAAEPLRNEIVYEDKRLRLGTSYKLNDFTVEEPDNTEEAISILEKVGSGSEGIVYIDMKNVDSSLKYSWKFIVNTMPWGIEDKWHFVIWDDNKEYENRDIWYFSVGGYTNKNIASLVERGRSKAKQLALELKRPSDVETMDAIVDYLQSTVTYGYDKDFTIGQMTYLSPFSTYGALVDKRAVCEGYSAAVTDIAMYCGIPCITLICEDINHSYNLYMTSDGSMYMLDATNNKKSYPANMNEHVFINDDANDTYHYSSSELVDLVNYRKTSIQVSGRPKTSTSAGSFNSNDNGQPKQYLSPSVTPPDMSPKPSGQVTQPVTQPVTPKPADTATDSSTGDNMISVEAGKGKIKVAFRDRPKYNRAGIPDIRYIVKIEGIDTVTCDTYTFTSPEFEIKQHLRSGLQYKISYMIDKWGESGGTWSSPVAFTVK